MKRPDGVTLISLYHFVMAGLSLVGICALVAVPFLVAVVVEADPSVDSSVAIVSTVIVAVIAGLMLFLYALACAVIGWGLWRVQPWARLGAMVLAVLRLFNVPVGTVIGGLILWYLFQPEARAAFEEDEEVAAAETDE